MLWPVGTHQGHFGRNKSNSALQDTMLCNIRLTPSLKGDTILSFGYSKLLSSSILSSPPFLVRETERRTQVVESQKSTRNEQLELNVADVVHSPQPCPIFWRLLSLSLSLSLSSFLPPPPSLFPAIGSNFMEIILP